MKTTPSPIREAQRPWSGQSTLFRGRTQPLWLAGLVCLLGLLPCLPAWAATRHVWQDSPSPAAPYATWTTAAHTIQDAAHQANRASGANPRH